MNCLFMPTERNKQIITKMQHTLEKNVFGSSLRRCVGIEEV